VNGNKLKKNLKRVSWAILILYVGSYIILSSMGKYDDRLDRSGKTKLADWGWSLPETRIWQPKYLMLRSNNWNYGGLVYSSLILLDRWVWHKNLPA
jgi:hypothetical protein